MYVIFSESKFTLKQYFSFTQVANYNKNIILYVASAYSVYTGPSANVYTVNMQHLKRVLIFFFSFHYSPHFPFDKGENCGMENSLNYLHGTIKLYFDKNPVPNHFTRNSTVKAEFKKNQLLAHREIISSPLTQFRKISAVYCGNIIKLINSLYTGFRTVTTSATVHAFNIVF